MRPTQQHAPEERLPAVQPHSPATCTAQLKCRFTVAVQVQKPTCALPWEHSAPAGQLRPQMQQNQLPPDHSPGRHTQKYDSLDALV